MSPSGVGRACLALALGLVVAACSGSPSATGAANAGGGGGAPNASGGGGAAAASGPAAAAGDLSKVDACKLLTPAEIHQAVSVPVGQGINQDSNIVRQCEWDSSDATVGLSVGVTVRVFDPSEWQTIQAFPRASPVSGMGEAAYRNSPLTGDLSVKHDGYEIDMAVVNFTTISQAQIDQATDSLMKLVLSRT